MTSDEKDSSRKTGYKSPPHHARFKKGQSGNPKGRPKGKRKLLSEWLIAELEQKIEVTENERRRKMTKGKAIAKSLINSALQGDVKTLQLLTKVAPELEKILATDESQPKELRISWIK